MRRRRVREEVEEAVEAGEQRAGDAERGELRPAKVADDRRVDQDVERLGGERAERREGEPEDRGVVLRAPERTNGRAHAEPLSPSLATAETLDERPTGTCGHTHMCVCVPAHSSISARSWRCAGSSHRQHSPVIANSRRSGGRHGVRITSQTRRTSASVVRALPIASRST